MKRQSSWVSIGVIVAGLFIVVSDVSQRVDVVSAAHELAIHDREERRWDLASALLNHGYPSKCVSDLLVELSSTHLSLLVMEPRCRGALGEGDTCQFQKDGEVEGRVGLGIHRLEACRRALSVNPLTQWIRWPAASASFNF